MLNSRAGYILLKWQPSTQINRNTQGNLYQLYWLRIMPIWFRTLNQTQPYF